jgi:hypothetical protein
MARETADFNGAAVDAALGFGEASTDPLERLRTRP